MKYIMFETGEGEKFPVIFPEFMTHSVVAEFVRVLTLRVHNKASAVANAGFVSLGNDVNTHGESESIGVKANPDDALRIMAGQSVSHMPDALIKALEPQLRNHTQES